MSTAMTSIVKLFGGDTTTEIKSFSAMAEALKNQVPILMKAVESFTAAGGGLNGMLSGFNTVISTHPVGAAVTALAAVTIPAVISVFDDYIHKTERLIEAGQKAKQTISDTISDYKNKQSIVNNSGDRFDELRIGVNQKTNQNISLTNDEYAEYLTLCNDIAEIYPELVIGYDSQGTAILNLGNNAETAKQQLTELLEADREVANIKIGNNLQSAFKGTKAQVDKIENKIKDLEEAATAYQKNTDTLDNIASLTSSNDSSNRSDSQDVNDILKQQLDDLQNGETTYLDLEYNKYQYFIDQIEQTFRNAGITLEKQLNDLNGDGDLDQIYFSLKGMPGDDQIKQAAIELKNSLPVTKNNLVQTFSDKSSENLFEISSLRKEADALWDELLQVFKAEFETNPNFNNPEMGDAVRSAILNSMSNIDWSGLPADVNIEDYLKQTYLYPLSEVFNSETQKDLQNSINKFFSLDLSRLSVEDYKENINTLLSPLLDYYIENLGLKAGKEKYHEFLLNFGIQMKSVKLLSSGEKVTQYQNYVEYIRDFIAEQILDKELSSQTFTLPVKAILDIYETSQNDPSKSFETLVQDYIKNTFSKPNSVNQITFSSLFQNDDGSESDFSKSIDAFQADISEIQSTIAKLNNGEKVDLTDLVQRFPELTGQTNHLNKALSNLKTDQLSQFIRSYNETVSAIADPKEFVKAKQFLRNLINDIEFSKIDVSQLESQLYANLGVGSVLGANIRARNILNEFKQEFGSETDRKILFKFVVDTTNLSGTPKEIRARFDSFKSEFLDDFSFENFMKDGSELSETVSAYTSEMQTLTSAKQQLTKAGGILDEKQVGELLKACPQLASYLGDLESGVDSLITAANNETFDYFTQQIQHLRNIGKDADADALEAYAQSVIDSANEIEGTFIRIGGLKIDTPNLAEWENSKESPGSTYDKMLSGYETAKKAYESNQIGDPNFKAFAKMISPTGSDDPLNFSENMAKFERYFQDGSDGCLNFLNDLEALGLAEKENGQWTYELGNSMDELKSTAEKLGIGFEPMMAIFGQLETYGFHNDFFTTEEDGVQHVEDLYSELAAEKRHLAEIQANPNTENYESAVEASKQKIAEYEERIAQCNETLDNMSANSSEEIAAKAEYAKEVARDLLQQMEDTDDLSLKESLQEELDDFARDYHLVIGTDDIVSLDEAVSNIDGIEIDFGAKGDELNGEIDQLSEKLQELREADPATADTTQISSIEAVLEFLIAKKQELEAPAVMNISDEQLSGVDAQLSSAIYTIQSFQQAYNELEHAQTLGLNTEEAQANLAQAREAIDLIDEDTQKTLGITVQGIDDVELVHQIATMDLSSFDGINKLSYEFHFINEETLDTIQKKVNQLPKEVKTTASVTDNATSVLTSVETVLDELNGKTAQTYINITRTETTSPNLFGSLPLPSSTPSGNSVPKASPGFIAGDSNAYGSPGELRDTVALTGELGQEMVVRGNRYFTVGDHGPEMVHLQKGDIVFDHLQTKELLSRGHTSRHGKALVQGNARRGTGPDIPSGSTSKTTGSTSGTTGKTGTNTSKGNGGDRDSVDWIEKLLKRIQREIKNLKLIADSAFQTFTARNKALASEISKVSSEIGKQAKAYNRYIAEAESVGLSSDLKEKVQNGTIDIDKYDDKTKKKISEYALWYEKALSCNDAIAELNETLSELYKQQFDNIITKWEKKLQDLEHAAKRTDSVISRRNDYASDHVTADQSRKASEQNIKDYQNLIKNNQSQVNLKSKELAELKKYLNTGKIPEDTEAWYDALAQIQSVESEIDGLNADIIRASNDISEEYVKIFDSISQEYQNKLSLSEHISNEYDNALAQAEAKGLAASAGYYQMLQSVERDNISVMKQELADLQQALYNGLASGEIEQGSQDWYDMTNKINGVSEAIQKAETQVITFGNSIREISWERFDSLQDQISKLTEETDFYIDLMANSELFDDNGITDAGQATLALHGRNYEIYQNQADQYAEQLKHINDELASNPADTKLIERKEELLELQRKSILAAEDEKQAIKNLVSEGIDAELDRLQDLIDKYTDALDSQKDLYDYQKNISNQTKKIAALQKQLSAYENDSSEETRSKIQKIKVELDEAKEQLQETQYDRYVSDQKQLLSDLYDEYEKTLNQRLDDITLLLEQVFQSIEENAGPISDTLNNLATDVGTNLSEAMNLLWTNNVQASVDSIKAFMENLSKKADEEAELAKKKITEEENQKKQADEKAGKVGASNPENTKPAAKAATGNSSSDQAPSNADKPVNTPKPAAPSKSPQGDGKIQVGDKVKYVSGEYYNDSYGGNPHGHSNRGGYVYITKINTKGTYPYHISTGKKLGSGDRGWLKKKQISGYARGAKRIAQNELGWTNENWETDGFETYVRKADGAILTPLSKDSRIYNAMASENMWRAANDPSGYIRQYSGNSGVVVKNVPQATQNTQIQMGDSQFNITLPSVKNYDEFKAAMQKDKSFTRFIQSITIDPIAGKSLNQKNRFNF